jgi:hypothetical protein
MWPPNCLYHCAVFRVAWHNYCTVGRVFVGFRHLGGSFMVYARTGWLGSALVCGLGISVHTIHSMLTFYPSVIILFISLSYIPLAPQCLCCSFLPSVEVASLDQLLNRPLASTRPLLRRSSNYISPNTRGKTLPLLPAEARPVWCFSARV